MRLIVLLGLVLCWACPVQAQSIKFTESRLQDAVVADGNGGLLRVDYYNTVVFHVTIATTATVNFEATGNGTAPVALACQSIGATDTTKVTSATTTGVFRCNVAGLLAVRARVSGWTAGAVTVDARASTAVFAP